MELYPIIVATIISPRTKGVSWRPSAARP